MAGKIIVMTFEDVRAADKVLDILESLRGEKLFELSDAVILVKDVNGYLEIDETREFTTEKGAISGGIAGLVVGTLLGGPIGGVLLGAAGGALAGRIIDLGIPDKVVRQVGDAMSLATSAILIEVKSGNYQRLIAAMEESGGKLFELAVSEEAAKELDKHVLDSGDGDSEGEA